MAYRVDIVADDVNSDIRALGVDLPMIESGGKFKLNYLSIDQAVANAKNLLLTNAGERVMHPTFGCNLRNVVFEGVVDDMIASIQSAITTQFATWLPYIFLNNISIIPDPDKQIITISVTISLIQNQFNTRSIVIEVAPNSTI